MLFDVFKGKFGFRITKRIGMDFDGNMMRRIGRNLAIDMESGELRLVTGWKKTKTKKMMTTVFVPREITMMTIDCFRRGSSTLCDGLGYFFTAPGQEISQNLSVMAGQLG